MSISIQTFHNPLLRYQKLATDVTSPAPRPQGAEETVIEGLGKAGNHLYHSVAHIRPAQAALAGGMSGSVLSRIAPVLGKAGVVSGLLMGGLSVLLNAQRLFKGEVSPQRAALTVLNDTVQGALGGMGSALFAGLATAGLGALGVVGWPVMLGGFIAGFIGYSIGEGLFKIGLREASDPGAKASTPTTPAPAPAG